MVQITAFIVDIGEVEFEDLEIVVAGFCGGSGNLVLLDVGSRDWIGFRRRRIR